MRPLLALAAVLLALPPGAAQEPPAPPKPSTAALFEDDAEELLKVLTNPGDGPGQGEPDARVVFSGTKSLKITHYQRFQRRVPGWNFAIREKPKPGEYRYLRFAWKSEGSQCLMLQLHDALDWHIRYTAGQNVFGWETRFVAPKPPAVWNLVTIDLHKDFGDRDLTGIAFTMSGGAGYFDHVHLGRTIDDLDRIDAHNLRSKKLKLTDAELEQSWKDLLAEDAAVAYRAFWTLVSGGERSVAFLKVKTRAPESDTAKKDDIRRWITDLDSDTFAVREKAATLLKKHLEAAATLLEAERAGTPSAEVRRRIEVLLALRAPRDGEAQRLEKANRIIRYVAGS